MKRLFYFSLIFIGCTPKEILYTASDLTAENLFSNNIEGPSYRIGLLYVVNFERDGTIGMVDDSGKASLFVSLPDSSNANAIQFNSKGEMLLADWVRHNILKVDMDTKAVSVFAHNDNFNQPNDIAINKRDQLFASDPSWKYGTGKLWRIEPNGETVLLADSMGTTNGIALSPDEKTLYVNESVQRNIWKFDVDEAGNISNKKLFTQFPDFGFDGMKCDERGNLYVTRHGKGTIVILSPTGEQLREVQMKGKSTSNITFGGKDGKTCYVTLQDRNCVEVFRSEWRGN
jgi:gluconolactonase